MYQCHGLVLTMNVFRNKDAKPDMLRKVRVGNPYFMTFFPSGSELSQKVVGFRVHGQEWKRQKERSAAHSGLVPRLIASICLFSVEC